MLLNNVFFFFFPWSQTKNNLEIFHVIIRAIRTTVWFCHLNAYVWNLGDISLRLRLRPFFPLGRGRCCLSDHPEQRRRRRPLRVEANCTRMRRDKCQSSGDFCLASGEYRHARKVLLWGVPGNKYVYALLAVRLPAFQTDGIITPYIRTVEELWVKQGEGRISSLHRTEAANP